MNWAELDKVGELKIVGLNFKYLSMKMPHESRKNFVRFFLQIALPDADYFPTAFCEITKIFSLVCLVPTDFIQPKFRSGLRHYEAFVHFVPMPEAPINENYGLVLRQNYIRPSW